LKFNSLLNLLDDTNLKTVIDKLAEFVSRNGTAFEETTREKKKDDPKFGFLEPGHLFNGYYKWQLWKSKYPHLNPHEVIVQLQQQQQLEQQQQAAQAKAPGTWLSLCG
jgi:hypothetical protein